MSKLEKAYEKLGEQTIKELGEMDVPTLKKRIVDANDSMRLAAKELEDNTAYQELKENKSAMESGMREVNSRQNAVILVALSMIEDAGQK